MNEEGFRRERLLFSGANFFDSCSTSLKSADYLFNETTAIFN